MQLSTSYGNFWLPSTTKSKVFVKATSLFCFLAVGLVRKARTQILLPASPLQMRWTRRLKSACPWIPYA